MFSTRRHLWTSHKIQRTLTLKRAIFGEIRGLFREGTKSASHGGTSQDGESSKGSFTFLGGVKTCILQGINVSVTFRKHY